MQRLRLHPSFEKTHQVSGNRNIVFLPPGLHLTTTDYSKTPSSMDPTHQIGKVDRMILRATITHIVGSIIRGLPDKPEPRGRMIDRDVGLSVLLLPEGLRISHLTGILPAPPRALNPYPPEEYWMNQ
jgi:hypothetical protein